MKFEVLPDIELKIRRDPDPESPREWDNLGTMICVHPRYKLGDKQAKSQQEIYEQAIVAVEPDFDLNQFSDQIWEAEGCDNIDGYVGALTKHNQAYMEALQEKFDELYVSLPLFLYDHSGITMNTTGFSCPWDSGQVGVIYVSHEKLEEEDTDVDKAYDILRAEVKVYDQYLRGDVYGFELLSDGEVVESCWGFYGDDWENNGMKDHIPEEHHHLLNDVEIIY